MPIPISYSARNLVVRKLTTGLTAGGMALVVFVFTAVLMMAEGLQKTLIETGDPNNVVILRKGSQSEVMSGVERGSALTIETLADPALGEDAARLLAKELLVLINLPKRKDGQTSNVSIRGIGAQSEALRPRVRIVQGRAPRPGALEVTAGASIAERFQGCGLGESVRIAARDWVVVGVFDAGGSGFASELWADAEVLMDAFRRTAFSSMIFRLKKPSDFDAFKARLEADPRLTHEAKRENQYYLDQSEMMAKFLRILGLSLTAVFSLGAVIGAMITMHAAVAHRIAEIGTLRALGFRRVHIFFAFLLEALLLSLLGWAAGVGTASLLSFLTISTTNFQTFAELAFTFSITPAILGQSLVFALGMGLLGGTVPAIRAFRLKIVDALRA